MRGVAGNDSHKGNAVRGFPEELLVVRLKVKRCHEVFDAVTWDGSVNGMELVAGLSIPVCKGQAVRSDCKDLHVRVRACRRIDGPIGGFVEAAKAR